MSNYSDIFISKTRAWLIL